MTSSNQSQSNQRYTPVENRSLSLQTKRLSQTPKMEPAQPVSPVSPLIESPSQTFHNKRPSAASVRELHHSRRHSSTDFRLAGPTATVTSNVSPIAPKLTASGTFPQTDVAHKKQPSFDRNWTLGSERNVYGTAAVLRRIPRHNYGAGEPAPRLGG